MGYMAALLHRQLIRGIMPPSHPLQGPTPLRQALVPSQQASIHPRTRPLLYQHLLHL